MRFVICLMAALGMAVSLRAQSPELGKRLFESQCALCHGQDGKGGRGPSLAVPKLMHASTAQALADVIQKGIAGTEMPGAWQLNPRELEAVAAFVLQLGSVPVERLPGDPNRGAQLFQSKGCGFCHIVEGQGVGYGPELTEIGKRRNAAYLRESLVKPAADIPEAYLMVEVSGPEGKVRGLRVNEDSFTIQLKDANQVFHSFRKTALKDLRKLFNESPMPSYAKRLSAAELDDLVAYLGISARQTMKLLPLLLWSGAFSTAPLATAQVDYDRILNSIREPGNWLTYSGNYQGHRFSPLKQLTPANVSGLRVKWVHQFADGRMQVSPLVVDGVMYITGPNFAKAVDARTGRSLWTWRRPIPDDLQTIGFGRTNRGAAILDDLVYVGTLDSHLIALDAKSGAVRWDAVVADYRLGHCVTVAPLAIRGKVIVGVSGGETGIRGFVAAYDARTGKQAWRFWTIPGPGEPGHETWTPASWKNGAGATWVTGAYDSDLNLVYWGTGNPGPDWNGDARPGDNLYTCSFVALDADTGKLRWHFQFTPHDTHDWDSTHVPMLIDANVRGAPRKLIANTNRNGFYYLLDRKTGEFMLGTPYAKQTWAKGLDDRGRPQLIPNMEPSEAGTLVWPSLQGSTNWFSPSYSPLTRLVYVSVREMGSVYYKREAEYKPLTFFAGGGESALRGDKAYGAIRAIEADTGKRRWEFRLHQPPWAGVMSTAGGLVFSGSDEGNFYALDAATGKPLWEMQAGGAITANPVSYLMDGKQHVAIAADRALFVFGL